MAGFVMLVLFGVGAAVLSMSRCAARRLTGIGRGATDRPFGDSSTSADWRRGSGG